MRILSIILVSSIVLQVLPLTIVEAEEGDTYSGSSLHTASTSSGSTENLINENTGSVLLENENNDLQNSSISTSPSMVSPLLIRMTEIAWMGSDLSTADEWIELTAVPAVSGAVLTQPKNLRGWTMSIQKESGESIIATIDQDLLIQSGAYLIIANFTEAQSRLGAEPSFISTAMSLPNTKLLLRLRDETGQLIDEVDDYVGAPFAGANPSTTSALPKATMERLDARRPGSDAANWRTAITSMGFDPEVTMLGSPGFPTSIPHTSSSSSSSSSQVALPPSLPILSELLPDPPGTQEEWIELANTGTLLLDISGWQLRSGSRSFTLPVGTILAAGERRVFLSSQTGLQLPNSGGDVQVWQNGVMVDHLLYSEMPDGVSVGRHDDGSIGSFCVPTPGAPNVVVPPTISLSGFMRGLPNPTSINLEVKALSGSLAGASCTVDYGDGFISNSCNPPSHSMKRIGHVGIKTTVKDLCGNTVTQQDDVLIVGGTHTKTTASTSTQRCIPSASGGIVISEFLPAPQTGQDEWIELRNTTDETISLCGWSIDDAVGGSRGYRLDDQSIDPGQYLLLFAKQTGLTLNNDADTVRLISPNLHGGTGVLLSIPYQDAETDTAFAEREDGIIIITPFPTPGSANRFTAIDQTPGLSPVIISAALPNPVGVDTWDEWIELTNVTGRPQWLNGWYIEDAAGHQLALDGRVLAKREIQNITLYKTSFTLANTLGSLKLIDDTGAIRSVLAWHDAEDGKRVRISPNCDREVLRYSSMTDDLQIRLKTLSGSTVIMAIPGIILDDNFGHYEEIKNYISALIKNKNIVLQKCSDSSNSLLIDEVDIGLLLLQQGFAIADPVGEGTRHDILTVYEDQARTERRGIWRDASQALFVDNWKQNRIFDHLVAEEGLHINVTPDTALLSTGSVISVTTNVPADVWVKQEGGAYRRVNGGVFVSSNSTLTFLASYSYKTLSGGTVSTSVLSQSYAVVQPSYPSCIRISEVYPSPKKGEHEWVELQNTCAHSVSLLGWSMDDTTEGGSKAFTIDQPLIMKGSGSYLMLSGSLLPIALNNGGDSVVLLSPDKRLQDAMTYLKVSAGRSIALVGDSYCQTTEVTQRLNNICVQYVAKSKTKSSTSASQKIVAGLTTKYLSSLLLESELSTKNDQFKALLEGLNSNTIFMSKNSILYSIVAGFLFIIGLLYFGIGGLLYMKKYRLWQ